MEQRAYLYLQLKVKQGFAVNKTFFKIDGMVPTGGVWVSANISLPYRAAREVVCKDMVREFINANAHLPGYRDGRLGLWDRQSKSPIAGKPPTPEDVVEAQCMMTSGGGLGESIKRWHVGDYVDSKTRITASPCKRTSHDDSLCSSVIRVLAPLSQDKSFPVSAQQTALNKPKLYLQKAYMTTADEIANTEYYEKYPINLVFKVSEFLQPRVYLSANGKQAIAEAPVSLANVPSDAKQKVDSTVSTAPSKPRLLASQCRPNSRDPSRCTSTISWQNAPSGSCVFVKTVNNTSLNLFACSSNGQQDAPWISVRSFNGYEFWLADQFDSSLVYATVRPSLDK
jgi:hypothetical protein